VLATLLVLVEAEGKVVSKTELLDRVWPDTYVEENNLTQNISALRKLLAADFPDERPIATLARIGYRFQLPVRVLDEASVPGQAALQIVEPTLQEVPAPDTAMSAAFSVLSDTQVILGHETGTVPKPPLCCGLSALPVEQVLPLIAETGQALRGTIGLEPESAAVREAMSATD
jgi:DNA-binding winged helix-turn-helix (wHTH) protein